MMSENNALIGPTNPSSIPESGGKGTGVKKIDEGKLKKACEDFESIFISQMLKEMRESIPKSGLLDGGSEQDAYLSLFDEAFSKSMAQGGGIGLGKILYQNVMKQVKPKGLTPLNYPLPPKAQGEKSFLGSKK